MDLWAGSGLRNAVTVPVQQVRLIAQGTPVWTGAPDKGECSWR